MKNKKIWFFFISMVLILTIFFGDRVVSEFVLSSQCKDNSGLFVYEVVDLDDDYIVSIPDDVSKMDRRFNISESQMIDYRRLERNYRIDFFKQKIVSDYGPVYSYTTSLVRMRDGKVLGKAVTFGSYMGWITRVLPQGKYPRKNCKIIRGGEKIDYLTLHDKLIGGVFKVDAIED